VATHADAKSIVFHCHGSQSIVCIKFFRFVSLASLFSIAQQTLCDSCAKVRDVHIMTLYVYSFSFV